MVIILHDEAQSNKSKKCTCACIMSIYSLKSTLLGNIYAQWVYYQVEFLGKTPNWNLSHA